MCSQQYENFVSYFLTGDNGQIVFSNVSHRSLHYATINISTKNLNNMHNLTTIWNNEYCIRLLPLPNYNFKDVFQLRICFEL